ncbi:2-oxoglutarate and iron-dependent oxygenase domain-containing protein 3-like [Gouania willdenowi]|uniref:2-oxoglutarate and iron-dependent oxygenase domain-containing protein 3-like n=1 Tax=Gouania willdenowi TaxID=441366 RepID=UPI001056254D|nr:2-oxoglutarate and iron-dependent oxygenase domain-containing protein 3-like [Gouania willdenowi]
MVRFPPLLSGDALRQGSSWRSSRWLGALLLVAVNVCLGATWLYVTTSDSDITETLVGQGEIVSPEPRVFTVKCSEDYENYKRYAGCTPQKCGRAIIDSLVTRDEAHVLRRYLTHGLALAGSEGGASILDLHSGALSMGKQFVNIYRYFGDQISNVFTAEDFKLYRHVRGRIQAVIAETFGLDPTLMYLTKPTFFSRINSTAAKTQHDEYWHPHIDKVPTPNAETGFPSQTQNPTCTRFDHLEVLESPKSWTVESPTFLPGRMLVT